MNLGSGKLRIYFNEEIADLAECYLKKELKVEEIDRVKVGTKEKTCGYYFSFNNDEDEYYCFRVYAIVERLKRMLEKLPTIEVVPK